MYALDVERVVRVLHKPCNPARMLERQALVDELVRAGAPFAVPEVLEVGEIEGITFAIERRLSGISVIDALRPLDGADRDRLVEAHLDAAAALGDLHLEPRDWYGDLIDDHAIRKSTWPAYLEARAAWSLQISVPTLREVDAGALAAALPDAKAPAFVHLDAFAGNMLAADGSITAVLDIGVTSVVGDRRLDPVAAVVYLASPEITGVTTPRDVEVAMGWLRNAGLHDLFEPAQRWLAAYWAFAVDDRPLLMWCEAVLQRG